MICLPGVDSPERILVRESLRARNLFLPPPVKTELLSGKNGQDMQTPLRDAPLLPITEGFWERAGGSRRLILSKGLKARLADTLIAQRCIDANVELIARDVDFRHFAQWCGLILAVSR